MVADLFYLSGLLIFFFSLIRIFQYFSFIDIREWVVAYKKVIKKYPTKDDFRDPKEYNLIIALGCLSLIETFWIMFGFATNDWKIFISFFLISIVLTQISNLLSVSMQKMFGLIFSILKSSAILIIVLNHFHFHLDIASIIVNFLFH